MQELGPKAVHNLRTAPRMLLVAGCRWMSIARYNFYRRNFMSTIAHLRAVIEKYKQIFSPEKKENKLGLLFIMLMQYNFISVQLDSGQFQENSQEYLR